MNERMERGYIQVMGKEKMKKSIKITSSEKEVEDVGEKKEEKRREDGVSFRPLNSDIHTEKRERIVRLEVIGKTAGVQYQIIMKENSLPIQIGNNQIDAPDHNIVLTVCILATILVLTFEQIT